MEETRIELKFREKHFQHGFVLTLELHKEILMINIKTSGCPAQIFIYRNSCNLKDHMPDERFSFLL